MNRQYLGLTFSFLAGGITLLEVVFGATSLLQAADQVENTWELAQVCEHLELELQLNHALLVPEARERLDELQLQITSDHAKIAGKFISSLKREDAQRLTGFNEYAAEVAAIQVNSEAFLAHDYMEREQFPERLAEFVDDMLSIELASFNDSLQPIRDKFEIGATEVAIDDGGDRSFGGGRTELRVTDRGQGDLQKRILNLDERGGSLHLDICESVRRDAGLTILKACTSFKLTSDGKRVSADAIIPEGADSPLRISTSQTLGVTLDQLDSQEAYVEAQTPYTCKNLQYKKEKFEAAEAERQWELSQSYGGEGTSEGEETGLLLDGTETVPAVDSYQAE